MTEETERWLAPMVQAIRATGGDRAITRLIDSALINAGLTWVQFGQEIRTELGWPEYPEFPPPTASPS
jgi:hypothetical protein